MGRGSGWMGGSSIRDGDSNDSHRRMGILFSYLIFHLTGTRRNEISVLFLRKNKIGHSTIGISRDQSETTEIIGRLGQFLYRIQPVRHDMLTSGSTEFESRIVSEHFNYLKKLTKDGVVILAGRTQNTDYSSFGIVLFNAETIEAAREVMLADPAVRNKVFRAELFPYKMALFGPDNAKHD